MWRLVHGLGAVLLVTEAVFVAALLLDGLVLPVGWWDRWCHPTLNLVAAGLVLLRAARPEPDAAGRGRSSPSVC